MEPIQVLVVVIILILLFYVVRYIRNGYIFTKERFVSTAISQIPKSQWNYNGTIYSFAVIGTNMNITIKKQDGSSMVKSGTWSSINNTTVKVFTDSGNVKLELVSRDSLKYTNGAGSILLSRV